MKKTLPVIFVSLLFACMAQVGFATVDTYPFEDEKLKDRFYQLVDELRCPKCQNQNLADSNSPISSDLRALIYRLINEGKSDDEIKAYLVDRYGEYILYRPQWSKQTWLLWLAPVLLLGVGVLVVTMMVRRRSAIGQSINNASLSEAEQKQVKELLDQADKPKDRT